MYSEVCLRYGLWKTRTPNCLTFRKTPAHCAIADGDQPSQPLIGKEPGALGIDLRSQDAGSVKTSAMFPVWRAA